jgi:hypothetical protein
MTLNEIEKILAICYTRKVTAIEKKGRRVVIEREVNGVEIAQMIAAEFGFELINEGDKSE